ncbi:ferri-bacillibactin esterase BesA [Brevibacillus parabrevis]|uniref:Ferri-bacillibactin esterase BesA n=2 Tax=Brevibacillus parabrevis TaxID=54914 RepID=A0A4Y3PK69_BREPA|nr:ferri-bacillibactin esterase BesA [Brevibacillus parabrevis]
MMDSTTYEAVAIPRSQTRKITYNERTFHLFVSTPDTAPPPTGFPVIYLLDANSVFGTMTEAIRLQCRAPEKTGVQPAIVVGIGYPTEAPFHPSRYYDFTHVVPQDELPAHPRGGEWPEMGGAERFLSFIEKTVKPAIEKDFPIDRTRQTIFGHSLGGLLVLHALLTRPHEYQCYIAGSPSIHWNESVLLEEERRLPERLTDELKVRALLTIGELENDGRFHVNVKAEAMAKRLSALGTGQIQATFRQFPDENHTSVLHVLISHAIRFASKTAAR